MNDFKPGDVVVHPEYGRGLVRHSLESRGHYVTFGSVAGLATADIGADLRRLVVIDPDDEDDMDRLGDILEDHEWQPKPRTGAFHSGLDLADALREFANPKPPKPEEPTGLGAVVVDGRGSHWVKADASATPWNLVRHPRFWTAYGDIDAVKVLSPGVEVES